MLPADHGNQQGLPKKSRMAAQKRSREAASAVFGQPRGRSGWSVHKNYRKSDVHVRPKWFEPIISQVICMSQKQLLKLKRKHIKLHVIENSFGPIISLLFWTRVVGRQFCLTPPITNGRLKWPIFSHFFKNCKQPLGDIRSALWLLCASFAARSCKKNMILM